MDDPTEPMDHAGVVEGFVREFFESPAVPATTHEEWLLRLCANLMHREATVVSVMERAQHNQGKQRCRPTRSSNASQTSTGASTATGGTCSSES